MPEKQGQIFLGRDEATYGKDGIGWVNYDPEYECCGAAAAAECRCPYQVVNKKEEEERLIHVGIASYRDPLCPLTLQALFAKAQNPQSLRVRILQQNDPDHDLDCLEGYCNLLQQEFTKTHNNNKEEFTCPYKEAVQVHNIHAKDAKGPTHARALLSQDIRKGYDLGEVDTQDYCLSMDSHMDFEPHWDTSMTQMWSQTSNEYAVLSTYVAGDEQLGLNLNNVHEVPHLCMVRFTTSVRTHATKCMRNMPRPKLTNAIYGAGLAFSKCHGELKVPVDPHTPFVFDGEEFNRAARLWTYGYDIYTPHRVYIVHKYHASQSNPTTTSWQRQVDRHAEDAANYRLNTLLDIPPLPALQQPQRLKGAAAGAAGGGGEFSKEASDEEKLKLRQSQYGLGDRRSLQQLIAFSGVDVRQRKPSIDGKNRCGNIQWVPFVEHERGVNYLPQFDAEENPLEEFDGGSVWSNPPVGMTGRQQQKGGGGEAAGAAEDLDGEADKPHVIITAGEMAHAQEQAQAQAQRNLHPPEQNRMYPQPLEIGARYLPAPIKWSVSVLVLGLVLSVVCGAGNKEDGRKGRRRGRKKRSL